MKLFTVLCIGIFLAQHRHPDNHFRIGCELKHVSIRVLNSGSNGYPTEGSDYLQISDGAHTRAAKSLNDLAGFVRIDSKLNALRYVRFRTSPKTWYLWRDSRSCVEILRQDDAKRIPTYGRNTEIYFADDNSDGYFGVLPIRIWNTTPFSRPTVHVLADGYSIRRWILVRSTHFEDGYEQQMIDEHVSKNGGYSIRLIKRIHYAPSNISWDIPGFL